MAPWEIFYRTSILGLLTPGSVVIDIGGGFRAVEGFSNRCGSNFA